MRNHTADYDTRLDAFHTDMLMASMHDTVDMMHAEDSDWTPVPVEYWGMSIPEIEDLIQEQAIEDFLAEQARNAIPHRWQ